MNIKRSLIYVAIVVICIVSIGVGVYRETITSKLSDITSPIFIPGEKLKPQEELKEEFFSIFDNKLNLGEFSSLNIDKINKNEDIVYTVYSGNEVNDIYEFEINLPLVNINNSIGSKFNKNTQEIFADKANNIMKSNVEKTIYTVSYTAYIYKNILSVIIKSNLKEGLSAQRTIIQTYNYNLETEKEATLQEVLQLLDISEKDVSERIKLTIDESIKEANKIQIAGYTIYERDANSEMYKIENTDTFYINTQGEIYIIYAYGNNEFTSEMDIVNVK